MSLKDGAPYILGLLGSPRHQGNTEVLFDLALKGAKEAGSVVEKFRISEYHLTPCQDCDQCLVSGFCLLEDDMQQFYPKLKNCDGLILASPIYFWGVTAQTKIFIDRCQAFWSAKKSGLWSPAPKKPGAFISCAGQKSGADPFFGAVATVKAFFATINVKYTAELLLAGIDRKGEVQEHEAAKEKAYLLGKNLSAALINRPSMVKI